MSLPLRLVYRSRPIQYPLIAAMNACDAWERAGLDLQSVAYVAGADKSDPMLVRGECDFIFGSHISPYLHRFHGQPFVYLGQCVNWVDDVLVSREPLRSLKRPGGQAPQRAARGTAERHHGAHPGGNHLLYLRREGVDAHKITFVTEQAAGALRRSAERRSGRRLRLAARGRARRARRGCTCCRCRRCRWCRRRP